MKKSAGDIVITAMKRDETRLDVWERILGGTGTVEDVAKLVNSYGGLDIPRYLKTMSAIRRCPQIRRLATEYGHVLARYTAGDDVTVSE